MTGLLLHAHAARGSALRVFLVGRLLGCLVKQPQGHITHKGHGHCLHVGTTRWVSIVRSVPCPMPCPHRQLGINRWCKAACICTRTMIGCGLDLGTPASALHDVLVCGFDRCTCRALFMPASGGMYWPAWRAVPTVCPQIYVQTLSQHVCRVPCAFYGFC